jgi:hypothetical protein
MSAGFDYSRTLILMQNGTGGPGRRFNYSRTPKFSCRHTGGLLERRVAQEHPNSHANHWRDYSSARILMP